MSANKYMLTDSDLYLLEILYKSNHLLVYRVHVDAVPEEEVAKVGGLVVFRLQGGESLQDAKSCVLLPLSDEAQTQVHGI